MGVCSASAQTTYHLEKVTSVEAGGNYVFVLAGKALGNTINDACLSSTSYKLEGVSRTDGYVWTLENTTTTGAFYMKNVSKGTYLANSNSSNNKADVSLKTSGSRWIFTPLGNETFLIQNIDNDNRFIGYNPNKNGFKAYAESNLSTIDHAITVYQLIEDPTTVTVKVGTKGFATLACDYALDFTDKSIKA